MNKVLLIVAGDGFRQVEYEKPKQILEEAGINVLTGSDAEGETRSAEGNVFSVDVTLENIDVHDYDGIFLVGGPGAIDHLDNPLVYKIMESAKEAGKYYGAICISPRILAKAGLLEDKKATGWNGDNELEKIFTDNGVIYDSQGVVVDGKLITGSGPDAAVQFGEAIAKQLG